LRPLATNAGEKVRLEAVSLFHLEIAPVAFSVEIGREVLIQERDEFPAKKLPPRHPLIVASTAMVVRTIEFPAGKGAFDPAKKGLVVGVHTEGDLRLPTIPAEVSFADQDSDQEADIYVATLFHRQVSRETSPAHGVVSRSSFP